MNLSYDIAQRMRKESRTQRPAVRMAIIAMALGICVMLLTLAIVIGFKREIENKVVGFGGHIQLVNFDNNNSFEAHPIRIKQQLLQDIRQIEGVRSVQPFALKTGMIKTESEFQPIVLKGVTKDCDWDFFSRNLIEGRMPDLNGTEASKEVIIGQKLAQLMQLKVDDTFFCYFIQENVRARKFHIVGIYNTDFSDYDQRYIMGDLRQIAALNQWASDQASGIEILLHDFQNLDEVGTTVQLMTANQFDDEGNTLLCQTIKQQQPNIFSWLSLLNANVYVIIILMLIVAGFNIISALIILILDGIQAIGILKALGAQNWMIQKVYIWQSLHLVGKGLFWGNLIGLGLMTLQYYTHLIPLDPTAYYVNYVPIYFHWGAFIVLNIGTLLTTALILLAPSYIITRISPAQVMRYE